MSLPIRQLSASFTTVASLVKQITLSSVHISNQSGSAVTVSVCEVQGGGTASAANALLWDFEIPANEFIEFGEGIVIVARASLQAKASVADVVNMKISYR